ncbi:MAG: response regulator transcription factor, partial [Caulobacteraceae bacterium]
CGSPGTSGLETVSWLRRNMADRVPILFLTRRADPADITTALDSGIDDYLVKPFQSVILRAKIGALLRRAWVYRPPAKVIAFEDYVFDTTTQTVVVGGKRILLTTKEFRLALLMFQNMNRALSRSYLLETIWDRNPALPTRTVETHMARLRSKLRLHAAGGYRLKSIYCYGYRLDRLGETLPKQNCQPSRGGAALSE